ncbi:MAG: hypothetical protein IKJ43_02505 [Bacilli bacterium]|nr:hypothetical protein [Bacilli bacterium]
MENKDEMENTREFPKVEKNMILEKNEVEENDKKDLTKDDENINDEKDLPKDEEEINDEVLNSYLKEEALELEGKKENNKNNSVKKFLLILLIVCVLGGLGFGLFKYFESQKPIKQVWGNTYYEYLRDFKKKDSPYPDGVKIEKPDEYQLHFYDVKGSDDPVMVLDYQYNNENYVNVYYIKDEIVNSINYFDPAHVELLYNIESREYIYYLINDEDGMTVYSDLGKKVNDEVGDDLEEITIEKDAKREVKDVNGNVHSISKFDETFIKPEIKDDGIKFNISEDPSELKKEIAKEADDFKDIKMISNDTSNYVSKSLDELVQKQKELDNYAAEVKTKEEEEAKKKAEEEAKKGIKVGNYTISYGTYKWMEDGQEAGVLVINNDGSCKIDGKDCTYSISSHDFAQDISTAGHPKTCLAFKTSEYTTHLYPYRDNELGDGDIGDYKLVN